MLASPADRLSNATYGRCDAQICSSFIIRHHSLHERIQDKLCQTMDAMGSSKGRANILYVVHDVIKCIRAGFPQQDRNERMRGSPLVVSLEKILYQLLQKLPDETRHNVRCAVAPATRLTGFSGANFFVLLVVRMPLNRREFEQC